MVFLGSLLWLSDGISSFSMAPVSIVLNMYLGLLFNELISTIFLLNASPIGFPSYWNLVSVPNFDTCPRYLLK